MYGRSPDEPDALSVRGGFLSRRRRLVPATSIDQIDGSSGVIGLSVERDAILRFL
jgi:membrane protein YdbS with pleckstrin-like domain